MVQPTDRRLHLSTLPNARDLGGLPVAGGSVQPNRVIRSASLATLSTEDSRALSERQLTRVVDLRTDAERAAAPNRLPDHVTQIHLDVFADSTLNIAAQMGQFAQDPAVALAAISGTEARDMLIASYQDLVNLPSAQRAYADFFTQLADPQHTGATLFHCTAGKDRTGWAAATLLTVLGASHDTVLADYLQTNEDSTAAFQPMLDQITAKGIDPTPILAVLGVDEAYLDTALQLVTNEFGSMEAYVVTGLGVSETALAQVRENLIA